MSTNKHAQIRYKTLDGCFSSRGMLYTIDDLLEKCNTAISEFDFGAKGIRKRQLFEDIRFMKSEAGWEIELQEGLKSGNKKAYRYVDTSFSISNEPITELDANLLRSALGTLSRFQGLPQFDWVDELSIRLEAAFKLNTQAENIISFEENEYLKGKDLISAIYSAIYNKKVLQIDYQSFKSEIRQTLIMSPYFLKQFNNRWFVFGQVGDYPNLTNLALDRIENIKESNDKYLETDIDFYEYFEDFVGVSDSSDPLQKIILRIDRDQWPYIKTKPLHGSQKLMQETENYTEISIEVKPNIELENMLLQFGEKIEVISPENFRNSISERVKNSYLKYFKL